jgi:hypothetical protein
MIGSSRTLLSLWQVVLAYRGCGERELKALFKSYVGISEAADRFSHGGMAEHLSLVLIEMGRYTVLRCAVAPGSPP